MTYKEYFAEHPEENLEWCKPYTDKDERYFLIMYEGEPLSLINSNGTSHRTDPAYSDLGTVFQLELEQLAKDVNPDYDLYRGYTDEQLALEHMHETGCANCPFRDDCDAMYETIEE